MLHPNVCKDVRHGSKQSRKTEADLTVKAVHRGAKLAKQELLMEKKPFIGQPQDKYCQHWFCEVGSEISGSKDSTIAA